MIPVGPFKNSFSRHNSRFHKITNCACRLHAMHANEIIFAHSDRVYVSTVKSTRRSFMTTKHLMKMKARISVVFGGVCWYTAVHKVEVDILMKTEIFSRLDIVRL